MTEKKSSGKKARDRDSVRLVVRTHPTLSNRLDAVMGVRRYKHPHAHLMVGTPLMKTLKDR